MVSTARLKKIKELLLRDYPVVSTPLHHKNAYELLVAVMLSAQTLDNTVNKISPAFFAKYPSSQLLAKANVDDVLKLIRIVNYNNTKAKHLVEMAKMVLADFGGQIPKRMEDLIKLPGVGRKTANVIICEWFVKNEKVLPEGFVVDTHIRRVAQRLGLSVETEVEKIEQDLMKIFPRNEWDVWSLRMLFHGRFMCKSQRPECKNDPEWSKVCSCVNI
jgi:endonuclease-3